MFKRLPSLPARAVLSGRSMRDQFPRARCRGCRGWIERMAVLVILTVASAAISFSKPKAAAKQSFEVPAGVTEHRDLVFAQYGSRELKLDLYRPESQAGPLPGIVFIHGGGWIEGNKDAFDRRAADMAALGFVTVSIDYRLSTEAPFPAALYDCKAAVRWMRANAAKYGIAPNKIAASGGSAGGHLAAMLGTTGDIPALEGNGGNANESSRVQAVVAFSGVYNVSDLLATTPSPEQMQKYVLTFIGGPITTIPEVYKQASPVAHVSKDSAPFFLLYGTADKAVPNQQAIEMQSALQAVGVRVELFTAQGGGHVFFNNPQYYELTLTRTEQFLRSVFGK